MKNYLKNKRFDFNKLIDVFDETPIWSAPFGLKLLDYVYYKPNITAIDIGFGLGFPLTELAMRLGNSCVVYGIDPWKEGFERVHKKIDYYDIKNCKLIEGVAEAIPLEDNSVDLITSNNGINNVQDIDKAFSECSRICKKGGQFVFTINLNKSMFEFYSQMEQVFKDMDMVKEIDLMHEHIALKRPALDTILTLLKKHDFLVKDLEHDQFNYKFTNGTALLNHYFIRLAFMGFWIEIIPPDKLEIVFDKIEKGFNERAKLTGGIKLSIPFVAIKAVKR